MKTLMKKENERCLLFAVRSILDACTKALESNDEGNIEKNFQKLLGMKMVLQFVDTPMCDGAVKIIEAKIKEVCK